MPYATREEISPRTVGLMIGDATEPLAMQLEEQREDMEHLQATARIICRDVGKVRSEFNVATDRLETAVENVGNRVEALATKNKSQARMLKKVESQAEDALAGNVNAMCRIDNLSKQVAYLEKGLASTEKTIRHLSYRHGKEGHGHLAMVNRNVSWDDRSDTVASSNDYEEDERFEEHVGIKHHDTWDNYVSQNNPIQIGDHDDAQYESPSLQTWAQEFSAVPDRDYSLARVSRGQGHLAMVNREVSWDDRSDTVASNNDYEEDERFEEHDGIEHHDTWDNYVSQNDPFGEHDDAQCKSSSRQTWSDELSAASNNQLKDVQHHSQSPGDSMVNNIAPQSVNIFTLDRSILNPRTRENAVNDHEFSPWTNPQNSDLYEEIQSSIFADDLVQVSTANNHSLGDNIENSGSALSSSSGGHSPSSLAPNSRLLVPRHDHGLALEQERSCVAPMARCLLDILQSVSMVFLNEDTIEQLAIVLKSYRPPFGTTAQREATTLSSSLALCIASRPISPYHLAGPLSVSGKTSMSQQRAVKLLSIASLLTESQPELTFRITALPPAFTIEISSRRGEQLSLAFSCIVPQSPGSRGIAVTPPLSRIVMLPQQDMTNSKVLPLASPPSFSVAPSLSAHHRLHCKILDSSRMSTDEALGLGCALEALPERPRQQTFLPSTDTSECPSSSPFEDWASFKSTVGALVDAMTGYPFFLTGWDLTPLSVHRNEALLRRTLAIIQLYKSLVKAYTVDILPILQHCEFKIVAFVTASRIPKFSGLFLGSSRFWRDRGWGVAIFLGVIFMISYYAASTLLSPVEDWEAGWATSPRSHYYDRLGGQPFSLDQ